jgi:hypothetical protein
MKLRIAFGSLALVGLTVGAAHARPAPPESPSLALTIPQVASELSTIVPLGHINSRNESIRYRPRWRQPRTYDNGPSTQSDGYIQLQGGVFDPVGDFANGASFGMRVGTSIDDRVQLGAQVDWNHRSDHQTAVIGTGTLPGGGTAERRVDLSSASSDLVPVMGFVQVSPTGTHNGPYVGIAGGYQALFLSAEDFTTHEDFNATYDGWGWQFYGGFAFPLSGTSRLTIEGFSNTADLDRKVDDPATGVTYREIVDAGGLGLRGGFSWGF